MREPARSVVFRPFLPPESDSKGPSETMAVDLTQVSTIVIVAIGMTLVLNIIMGGPLTGAAFNPARALGPMVATGNFSDAWLYLTAPIVGAIVAAILHTGLARLAQERMASAGPRTAARTPAE